LPANRSQPVQSTWQPGIRTFSDLYPPGFRPAGGLPDTQPVQEPADPSAVPVTQPSAPAVPSWTAPVTQAQPGPMMPAAVLPAPAVSSAAVATPEAGSYPRAGVPSAYPPADTPRQSRRRRPRRQCCPPATQPWCRPMVCRWLCRRPRRHTQRADMCRSPIRWQWPRDRTPPPHRSIRWPRSRFPE
jgi:hypothetical protein